MNHKINDTQDIQEIERFFEKFPDERKEVSEVVDKVDERIDEARGNDELIRNDAQGILHIVEKLEKDGKKYEIGDVVNAFEHLRKEDKKKDEIPKVVDKVDDRNDEDRRNDEVLKDGLQRVQYILDKLEEDGKAYEWSKIVNTLEYLSKGRKDESDINVRDDDDDDEVFIEGEVDKRTEKEKESGKEDRNNKKINVTEENNMDAKTSKINTEKEDIGNKNETKKRTIKKGKRTTIAELCLCAVCNKNITCTSIQCKACLKYVHLRKCTDFKNAKEARVHGEFYRCPNCVRMI